MTSIFRASIALAGLVCSTGAVAQLSDFYRPVLPPNVSEGGIAGLGFVHELDKFGADVQRQLIQVSQAHQHLLAVLRAEGGVTVTLAKHRRFDLRRLIF